MEFKVNQKDFNTATQNCLGKKKLKPLVTDCLVATAIKRTFNPYEVRVGFHYCHIKQTKDSDWIGLDIPEDITQVIYDWCAGELNKVTPLLPLKVVLEERN